MASRKDPRATPLSDFCIGGWAVQPALNRIRSGATVRRLAPQVMDLLAFLGSTKGRVVSKSEIVDAVWEGRFISDATLTRSVAELRRALGDDQRRPEYIETIPKRGYRLVAPVSGSGAAAMVPAVREGEGESTNGRIADRLASARRSRFVGREAELEMFRSAVAAAEPPFAALHVTGPGGVGKTTLLQEFARVAGSAGRAVVRIDGRNIDPSPRGFLVALNHALGADEVGAAAVGAAAVAERWPTGGVLLVDTCELLAPIDDWLRQTLLPQLSRRSIVVMAGRNEPATAWRTDVEWGGLTRMSPLANLGADESRTYLSRREVAAEHHDAALAFTRGHPLALSLIADVLTAGDRLAPQRLDAQPEVVRLLLETFVREVPSREHRLALHACATSWATTEPLLAAVLDRSDASELFEWLGRLTFVEHGPYGLFPHDLARDVVYRDFRWRDPDAAARVTERILGYLYSRIGRTQGLERQRVWFDVLYVQRYNPCVRPYFEWGGFGTAYAETAGAQDHAAILEMVERHEGARSASIARYWLARQPEAFLSVRSVGGELLGFSAQLSLESVSPDDSAADPAVAHAFAYVERHGPSRPGERVLYGRFWMDAGCHQTFTQVFTAVAASWLQASIGPNVAWSFVAMAQPDAAEPMFRDLHIFRAPEADFEVDGRGYGAFAHDWRVEPVHEWLRWKAERATRVDAGGEPDSGARADPGAPPLKAFSPRA